MALEPVDALGAVFTIDGRYRFIARYVRKSAKLGRIHISGYPMPNAPCAKTAPVGIWVGPLAGEFTERDFMLIAITQFARLWNSDRPALQSKHAYEMDFDPVAARYAGNVKWVDSP